MKFAVLLAAGSSRRFAETCPLEWTDGGRDKLQVILDGVPLWRVSYDRLAAHPEIAGVGIVCSAGEEPLFAGVGAAFVVAGGSSRAESSLIGVAATPVEASIVLVHDAARPELTPGLISRVIAAAEEVGAAIPALAITETVKRGGDLVSATVAREGLFRVQTPQAARRDWLLEAMGNAKDATDEAMALERAGFPVRLVEGDERNRKVTTFDDLRFINEQRLNIEPLTGIGYDVHAFSDDPSRVLVLCGVAFPGERGLAGHSDADAAIHALVDAILGACGAGDIGKLFPDTDAEWKDADSRVFLREAVRLLRESGATLVNADITILAERPKISSRREEMRAALAKELGIPATKVNVKATTHEGMGAIGRSEGIGAMATVSAYRKV